jgi:hypothetical protein
LVCLFPRKKLCINIGKQLVLLHFGQYFQKLIWSPCLAEARGEQNENNKLSTSEQKLARFTETEMAEWADDFLPNFV